MSVLTDGPFGPGNRPPAMPHGDYLGREWPPSGPEGVTFQEVTYRLAGEPPRAQQGSWGDLGWVAYQSHSTSAGSW